LSRCWSELARRRPITVASAGMVAAVSISAWDPGGATLMAHTPVRTPIPRRTPIRTHRPIRTRLLRHQWWSHRSRLQHHRRRTSGIIAGRAKRTTPTLGPVPLHGSRYPLNLHNRIVEPKVPRLVPSNFRYPRWFKQRNEMAKPPSEWLGETNDQPCAKCKPERTVA
jgi:hypothetical protein